MITNSWASDLNNWPMDAGAFQPVPHIKERDGFRLLNSKDSLSAFPVQAVRREFPILAEKVNGKQLIWFDNAATTQKPACVIERLDYFYRHENSNVHRGAHTLAARATDAYEAARETVRHFLHAASSKEILFVRGTTEAVNLIARTYGVLNIGEGDEILISHLEHHANIVPWQLLCEETGAVLRVIPVDDTGQIELGEYGKLLNHKTKLVSLAHVSNALGTVAPIRDMINMAHGFGAKIFIDGAQAVSHLPVDVTELDCDFYAFSGHKIYGPTGIGALYVKGDILKDLPPYQGGGNMISDVTFEKTRYQDPPARFEAGTGNIADAVGLGAALDYVTDIGLDKIFFYEHALMEYAMEAMLSVPGLSLIGTAEQKTSILSFLLKGFPNEEVGKVLNQEGIAVRTGHHCAQPILRRFGLESTVRPSIAFYNTKDEIDEMVRALKRLQKTAGLLQKGSVQFRNRDNELTRMQEKEGKFCLHN
ncbi:MAG TPA: family 2A encapsulin nanocompartment cargo protein cysteine desulfurase [Anaerovoracaceae bacterium]|nr:family 2A encapsulin nanocompartment cargo protein cysteine desulfurase [Anaerovoracaceae bacterium]